MPFLNIFTVFKDTLNYFSAVVTPNDNVTDREFNTKQKVILRLLLRSSHMVLNSHLSFNIKYYMAHSWQYFVTNFWVNAVSLFILFFSVSKSFMSCVT